MNGTASDGAAARESSGAAPTADSKKTAPTESGKHKSKSESAGTRRRMFISVLPGEQVEVALTEDGQLLEYYLDMLHQRKIKGNIYKGVIHNIDTNLQAAFVSYGAGKNGFLQIDEIHPEYWLTHHEPAKGKKFPPIQKVLKAGQEVLVQVVKEPTGSKGAFLTTWLSLAGRFLVLTPGQEQIGVSRKVDDEEERSRLREMMNGIDPGQGLGVIVRTVSAGTTKTTLKNDLQYLKRVWRDIRKKATEVTAPALIYQEPGLSERAVRDYLTEDVGEIWVDHEDVAQSIRETVNLLFPRKSDLVRLHSDVRTSMWERFSLRRQLDQIYTREVLLPSGGRLVFDQTEALMAVDINSGKISGKGNFEAMAHKTNMEAAETIARHLKLRDIGGQVVIDFIEMRDKKHIIEVEKTLRSAMKNDRARHDVGRMSAFGLLELVRQRTGSSALAITMEPCPACGGT
ncbi:Rne/Rng family ribonuclease, partial [Desulfovibrio sp. 1214_IL3152]|uniref:Rne/Rng family ribonuclease n=1 Tax=Desulfovibrio sp. 1214_IL3152 TaxID=3084056 RepID=UPI002FDAF856